MTIITYKKALHMYVGVQTGQTTATISMISNDTMFLKIQILFY